MKKSLLIIAALCAVSGVYAQSDTIIDKIVIHPEVVVTGTRNAIDQRYLPPSIAIVLAPVPLKTNDTTA